MEASGIAAATSYSTGRRDALILSVAAALLGLWLSWIITRSITTPLEQLSAAARGVAVGDLSTNVRRDEARDELGELTHAFADVLDGERAMAEEVRSLALRSAEAARNTAALVEEVVTNAEAGVRMNGEVASQLQTIAARAERVGVVTAEIAAASAQQASGVEQVNTAVEQMNVLTQQVAASAEESASAAEELDGQATQLAELVGLFRLDARVSRAGAASPVGEGGVGGSLAGRRNGGSRIAAHL